MVLNYYVKYYIFYKKLKSDVIKKLGWKDDVDRMIDMTRTRQRYNPELYDLPFPAQPRNARSPGVNQILDAQEEIDGERYRAHMLERQINDMARVHAREKQDLIQRLEELK